MSRAFKFIKKLKIVLQDYSKNIFQMYKQQ